MTARGIAIMTSAGTAVAVIAAAYLLGTYTSHHHPAPAGAAAPAVHPGGVAVVVDPVTVATGGCALTGDCGGLIPPRATGWTGPGPISGTTCI
jgi:hypothetical protein